MTYSIPPRSLKSLEQRIRNLAADDASSLRRQVTMAMVVVGQMLPDCAIKGGTAMALRYGRADTRFTQDIDAARAIPLADFLDDFEASLNDGWAGFTRRVVDRKPPRPPGIPPAYVMQPFDVKLDYQGRLWRTVNFELGHNEIDDAVEPEFRIAADLVALFSDLGLPAPGPIPVMRADHQVAQKLPSRSRAASAPATSSTYNCSTGVRLSTSLWCERRAKGSSSTDASSPGRPPLRPAQGGTRCTRLRSRRLTRFPTSTLPSFGSTP